MKTKDFYHRSLNAKKSGSFGQDAGGVSDKYNMYEGIFMKIAVIFVFILSFKDDIS